MKRMVDPKEVSGKLYKHLLEDPDKIKYFIVFSTSKEDFASISWEVFGSVPYITYMFGDTDEDYRGVLISLSASESSLTGSGISSDVESFSVEIPWEGMTDTITEF